MALIKCKECKADISSDAKKCPHCGKKQKIGLGYYILWLVVLVLIFWAVEAFWKTTRAEERALNDVGREISDFGITYKVVRGSGSSYKLLVPPKHRNLKDMTTLGGVIHNRYKTLDRAEIMVYDDKDSVGEKGPHHIGTYSKMHLMGTTWTIYLEGNDKPATKEIEYYE